MQIKIYEYSNCSTCQKALKYLDSKGVKYDRVPIVDKPPSSTELKAMAKLLTEAGGSFKNLFNVSGQQYRELKIGDKLKAGMTEDEALKLMAKNGKLIKRPFLLTPKGGTVGFRPEIWDKLV